MATEWCDSPRRTLVKHTQTWNLTSVSFIVWWPITLICKVQRASKDWNLSTFQTFSRYLNQKIPKFLIISTKLLLQMQLKIHTVINVQFFTLIILPAVHINSVCVHHDYLMLDNLQKGSAEELSSNEWTVNKPGDSYDDRHWKICGLHEQLCTLNHKLC